MTNIANKPVYLKVDSAATGVETESMSMWVKTVKWVHLVPLYSIGLYSVKVKGTGPGESFKLQSLRTIAWPRL